MLTAMTTPNCKHTSRHCFTSYAPTMTDIMLRHQHLRLPTTDVIWLRRRRQCLPSTILISEELTEHFVMSSTPTFGCLLRSGKLVTLSNGGRQDGHNFQTSPDWPEIYYQFLVSNNPRRLYSHSLFCTGSSVAVERIFSGGRDTISLRRASLSAETIQALMFTKNRLILARNAIDQMMSSS